VTERSYPLDEVVSAHLPSEWTDGKRWLTRRLNRKELRGRRFGRQWRMTDGDIAYMLQKFANFTTEDEVAVQQPPATSEVTSEADGLSARSARLARALHHQPYLVEKAVVVETGVGGAQRSWRVQRFSQRRAPIDGAHLPEPIMRSTPNNTAETASATPPMAIARTTNMDSSDLASELAKCQLN
jgi:hypothetical protein